jgi:hypothetical protein
MQMNWSQFPDPHSAADLPALLWRWFQQDWLNFRLWLKTCQPAFKPGLLLRAQANPARCHWGGRGSRMFCICEHNPSSFAGPSFHRCVRTLPTFASHATSRQLLDRPGRCPLRGGEHHPPGGGGRSGAATGQPLSAAALAPSSPRDRPRRPPIDRLRERRDGSSGLKLSLCRHHRRPLRAAGPQLEGSPASGTFSLSGRSPAGASASAGCGGEGGSRSSSSHTGKRLIACSARRALRRSSSLTASA